MDDYSLVDLMHDTGQSMEQLAVAPVSSIPPTKKAILRWISILDGGPDVMEALAPLEDPFGMDFDDAFRVYRAHLEQKYAADIQNIPDDVMDYQWTTERVFFSAIWASVCWPHHPSQGSIGHALRAKNPTLVEYRLLLDCDPYVMARILNCSLTEVEEKRREWRVSHLAFLTQK